MPPPDKFHDRWYLLGLILLVTLVVVALVVVVLVALFWWRCSNRWLNRYPSLKRLLVLR